MIDSSASHAAISGDLLPSDLQLRVRGGQHGGRLIRLVGDKLTIGSAPRSSLRLLASGIHPVHCLIVRGRQGTIVRRWNGDTQLNGKSFTDEWLQAGDHLRLGTVELEVLADRQEPSRDESDGLPAMLAADDEKGESTPAAADVSTEQFQGRLQLLLEHQRQLSEREHELEDRQSELEFERQQWCQDREAELAELDAREECLRALREEIETARQTHSCDRHAHDDEWTQERDRLLCELQQTQLERDELKRMVDDLTVQRRADQGSPRTASEADSLSEMSVQDAEIRSGVTETEEPVNDQLHTPAEPAAELEVPSPATHEPEEFSIEAYMSQLLQRVGARPSAPDAKQNPTPAAKPVEVPASTEPQSVERVDPVNADPELIPRARPLPVDLGALRDVANQTARLAIERHARRLWWQAAAGKWFVVAVAMIAGSGLVYWAARGKTPAGFGLFAAGLVAIVWSAQAIWLTQRAVRIRLSERCAKKPSACKVSSEADVPSESH